MPQLTGTAMPNPSTMIGSKAPFGALSPTTYEGMRITSAEAVSAAAKPSQRSCSRSSPEDRRARMIVPPIANRSTTRATSQITPGAPFSMSTAASDPSGFGMSGIPPFSWIVFWSTRNTNPTASTANANAASHRARRECRCPSGNSRKKNVARPAGNTSQSIGSWNHATHAAAGSGATR